MTSPDAQAVLERIDTDELVRVALDLGNIDSPTGREGPVADYVHDWLLRHGFESRRVGLFPHRPNVVGRLPGRGRGLRLAFNSHMDTIIAAEEVWTTRRAADRILHAAWRRPGRQRYLQRQGAHGRVAAGDPGHPRQRRAAGGRAGPDRGGGRDRARTGGRVPGARVRGEGGRHPVVSVGGGNFGMRIEDLVTGARLYALTALFLCSRERA